MTKDDSFLQEHRLRSFLRISCDPSPSLFQVQPQGTAVPAAPGALQDRDKLALDPRERRKLFPYSSLWIGSPEIISSQRTELLSG